MNTKDGNNPSRDPNRPCDAHVSSDSRPAFPSHHSHSSHHSLPPQALPRVIAPRGDYRTLLSYQKAETVYDLTFRFAHKHLAKGDRTIDQMIQSARSGKQNILEGSKAATASKETEIKLTSVAPASLEELLADYHDFLRVRDLPVWTKDSTEAEYVRRFGRQTPSLLNSTGSLSTPGQPVSWPISPSASSTRPTSSSTGNFAASTRISLSKGDSASA